MIACTHWNSQHLFLLDLNPPENAENKANQPVILKDDDKNNDHATDLLPLPRYDPETLPLMIKRGQSQVMLVDVINKRNYTLFHDENNKWGYHKIALAVN